MWTTVIVDEGHRLKNEKSQLSEKLRIVPTLCRVILTGTPLQNNLRELWALLHFLAPEVFTLASAEYFDDGFDLLRRKIDTKVLRNARRLLSVFMLRRIKEHVNIVLPSKKEITLVVPLTSKQVDWYKYVLSGLDDRLVDIVMNETNRQEIDPMDEHDAETCEMPDGKESVQNDVTKVESIATDQTIASDWRRLMNLLLQLRKICNHVYLMPDSAPDPYEITEEIVSGSGKLILLDRMLPRLKADNHRVLLFSQFTSMLDILEDYCKLRDWKYVRLDGNTNRVQRRLDVRRYNEANSQIFIFLISTRAGGLGLNLASADTVILYDSDWNPQVDIQAMERVHRIGQTKPVRIFRLVCRGSVEERMISRADKKLFLTAMVAEDDIDVKDIAEGNAGNGREDSAEDEMKDAALSISNSMSKREMASLLRFSASAIIGVDNVESEETISDAMLDKILERQGRDLEFTESVATIFLTNATLSDANHTSKENTAVDSNGSETKPDPFSRLREVDLRQLGNVVYNKKRPSHSEKTTSISNMVDGKRRRVERIQLVDGFSKNSPMPVLKSCLDEAAMTPAENPLKVKSRTWSHQIFCCLCGKHHRKQSDNCVNCAHCPRSFHYQCLGHHGITRKSGTFICPHHKCASCGRNTASSGGLLFRCVSCLTSYCEDCLPQEDIESIGRCEELEKLGYESKQSYFVKCPVCIMNDQKIVQNNQTMPDSDKIIENADTSNDGNDLLEDAKDEQPEVYWQVFPSHSMRIMEEQRPVADHPSNKSTKRKGKIKSEGNRNVRSTKKKNSVKEMDDTMGEREEESGKDPHDHISDETGDMQSSTKSLSESLIWIITTAESLDLSDILFEDFLYFSEKQNKAMRSRWEIIVNKVSNGNSTACG